MCVYAWVRVCVHIDRMLTGSSRSLRAGWSVRVGMMRPWMSYKWWHGWTDASFLIPWILKKTACRYDVVCLFVCRCDHVGFSRPDALGMAILITPVSVSPYLLNSLCAHWPMAETRVLHFVLSAACFAVWPQLKCSCSSSFSIVLLHVFWIVHVFFFQQVPNLVLFWIYCHLSFLSNGQSISIFLWRVCCSWLINYCLAKMAKLSWGSWLVAFQDLAVWVDSGSRGNYSNKRNHPASCENGRMDTWKQLCLWCQCRYLRFLICCTVVTRGVCCLEKHNCFG